MIFLSPLVNEYSARGHWSLELEINPNCSQLMNN